MASDNLLAYLQNRNVLIQSEGIVPNDELVHGGRLSKRISKKKVEEFAIQRYGTCGRGISFSDVITLFHRSKAKAQRILKDCCQQGILFRLNCTRPQHYYPSVPSLISLRESKEKGNVPIHPSGVNHSSSPFSSPPALNNTDQIVLQTLEGHILPLLPTAPSYIHNIHLKLTIPPHCYVELGLPTILGNNGKKTTQIIGKSKVDYTFYPIGTVTVEVM